MKVRQNYLGKTNTTLGLFVFKHVLQERHNLSLFGCIMAWPSSRGGGISKCIKKCIQDIVRMPVHHMKVCGKLVTKQQKWLIINVPLALWGFNHCSSKTTGKIRFWTHCICQYLWLRWRSDLILQLMNTSTVKFKKVNVLFLDTIHQLVT